MDILKLTAKREAEFWSRVDKSGDCWLWTGNCVASGYGRFSVNQISKRAHRVAWMLTNGPIPDDLIVCHRCDVRNCVNPDHLFLGTSADNRHDQDAKGRHYHGERVNTNKLTEEQVLEIRKRFQEAPNTYGMNSQLAREYGVSNVLIGLIARGKSWKHLK